MLNVPKSVCFSHSACCAIFLTTQAAAGNPTGRVVAYEPQQQFLDRGRDRIEASIAKLVAKNKITKEVADQTLGSIEYTTDLSKLKDTDLIVEAVVEDMALKEQLYTELGGICQKNTIFASNTSSLSIAEMASFSGRPEKFVGVHFFNPVQVSI
jgi:3-hydroxyacyl-CoA dehydrogenase